MKVLEKKDLEREGELENTFKFRTIFLLILGVVCLSTIATAVIFSPLFFYAAYRTYKEGSSSGPFTTHAGGKSPIEELEKLKGLLDSGALTQEEYDTLKAKLLSQIDPSLAKSE